MNAVQLNYRGRLPSRSDGKARREAILEAALAVIVENGIRGVRHRAVAEKAGVPLAATTYYFNDILDLIHDAFVFYAEKSLNDVLLLEERGLLAVETVSREIPLNKTTLVKLLSDAIASYVVSRVGKKELRVLELTFKTQALRDERFVDLVRVTESRLLQSIENILNNLKIESVPSVSHSILNLILQVEYKMLIQMINETEMASNIHHTLSQTLLN